MGAQFKDNTIAADAAVLLPVVDGNLALCCQPNAKFVRVQISLDFCLLVTVEPLGITTLHVDYYIELPQVSWAMVNGAGVGYNLGTYHGADDLCTLDSLEAQASILDLTLVIGHSISKIVSKFTIEKRHKTSKRSKSPV